MRNPRWKLIQSETLICDQWLTVERNTYSAPAGLVDHYYVIRRRPFVVIVAEHEEGVVLIRQYRPATNSMYWSLPAGYIDGDESVIAAADRELREETGFVACDSVVLGRFDPLPGYLDSPAHVVRCRVDRNPLGTPDDEAAAVVIEPWPRIHGMISAGSIVEMQAVTALLLAHDWQARDQTRPSVPVRP